MRASTIKLLFLDFSYLSEIFAIHARQTMNHLVDPLKFFRKQNPSDVNRLSKEHLQHYDIFFLDFHH